MINRIKFLLISAVTLLFLIQSFNIEGFGAVNDVPHDLEYGKILNILKPGNRD